MIVCRICGKKEEQSSTGWYEVTAIHEESADLVEICSPSCLVSWAWDEKSAQTKLSKSKVNQ